MTKPVPETPSRGSGPGNGGTRITLAAIGRRAGVSTATVSKVVNGRPDVAPETRRRVQAVLAAYGYVSNHSGASGSSASSLIDLLMIEMDDPWAAKVLSAMEGAARRHGLGIVPSVVERQTTSDDAVTRVLARGSRGVIAFFCDVTPRQHNQIQAHGMPYVLVAPGRRPLVGAAVVNIDFRTGIRSVTQHLIGLGHRRIGIVLGRRGLDFSDQRYRGYQDALSAAGIAQDPSLVRWGEHSAERACSEALDLLDLPDRPTAIVAASDTMAVGVYRAAQRRDLMVGRDLAVTGFDDRPEAEWMSPPLTTVRIPLDQLADAAVELVVDPVVGRKAPALAGKLIKRRSTDQLSL